MPRVTIDFGGGNVINRTLHGNIATYVCTADGHVLDVLPGVYAPDAYLDQLKRLRVIGGLFGQFKGVKFEEALKEYHAQRAITIRNGQRSNKKVAGSNAVATTEASAKAELEKNLSVDTGINESARRLQIHQHIVGLSDRRMQPKDLTRWLYREVLHADLDDPYMGLGKLLFDSYPFAREDMSADVAGAAPRSEQRESYVHP